MFVEEKQDGHLQELKTKREALGLSLADIYQRTRISVTNLQAIENNDFHLLPTAAYAKNFIKTYARTLEIDSEPILARYEDYLNAQKTVQVLRPVVEAKKKSIVPKIGVTKIYWLMTAFLGVVIILILLISQQYQPSSDIATQGGNMTVPVQEKKEPPAIPVVNPSAPVNAPVQTAPEPLPAEVNLQKNVVVPPVSANSEKNKAKPSSETVASPLDNKPIEITKEDPGILVISAVEETWIRIKADQNPSSQMVLKPGEKIERKAASFVLDIGNAGGIKIKFKGKNLEKLGEPGQVVHLRLQ